MRLRRAAFARSVHEVAPELIGATLLVDGVGGRIVEVEAYDQTDPASHSFGGPSARNRVMFGPAGPRLRLPLLRHPLVHEPRVRRRRRRRARRSSARSSRRTGSTSWRADGAPTISRLLCAGPGRLCQALGVTGEHDGLPLDRPPFRLLAPGGPAEVVRSPRVGISKAVDRPWRYSERGSRYVSRPLVL